MSTINEIQNWINNLGQCNTEESIRNWLKDYPGQIANPTTEAYKNIIMYDIPSVDKYLSSVLNDGMPENKDPLAAAIYAGLMNDRFGNPKIEQLTDGNSEQVQAAIEDKENAQLIQEQDQADNLVQQDQRVIEEMQEKDPDKNVEEQNIVDDQENFDDPYAPANISTARAVQRPIENIFGRINNFFANTDIKTIVAAVGSMGFLSSQYLKFLGYIGNNVTKIPKSELMKILVWCAKNWKLLTAAAAMVTTIPALYTAIGRLMSKDPAFAQNQDYAKFVAREYAKLYPAKYKAYTQYRFSELNQTLTEKNLTDLLMNCSVENEYVDKKLMDNQNFTADELVTILTGSGYDLADANIKKAYLLKIINDPFFRERMSTYMFSELPEDMKVNLIDLSQNFSSSSLSMSNALSSAAKVGDEVMKRRLLDVTENQQVADYARAIAKLKQINTQK